MNKSNKISVCWEISPALHQQLQQYLENSSWDVNSLAEMAIALFLLNENSPATSGELLMECLVAASPDMIPDLEVA